jgi:hypothetical protein
VEIAVPCTLRRVKGSPVAARTLNLGSGGMLVTCARPLAIDEQVDFDFTSVEMALCGHARVVRRHGARSIPACANSWARRRNRAVMR